MRAQALGEHGRQNIRLLGIRERGEDIRAVDVFFEQQFLIGRIAVQHGRAFQLLRNAARAFAVALDELDLILAFQLVGQPQADVAAAGDHDAPRGRLLAAQFLHDDADIFARGQKKYLIAVLDDRRALGLDALAGPINGRNACVGGRDVLAQGAQGLAHQGSALQGANADQAHPAIGEIQNLQRAGVADQARHIFGHQLFRTDPDVDGDAVLAEQPVSFGVVGGAHPRDLLRRAVQRPGNLARQHVDFIAVGERDENVGGGDSRGLENARARAIAVDRADIEPILKIPQYFFVVIDDGHVVRFLAREVICRRAAHLSGTQNDDFHSQEPVKVLPITLHDLEIGV